MATSCSRARPGPNPDYNPRSPYIYYISTFVPDFLLYMYYTGRLVVARPGCDLLGDKLLTQGPPLPLQSPHLVHPLASERERERELRANLVEEGALLNLEQVGQCSGSEAGSYLRLIDFCITQLSA